MIKVRLGRKKEEGTLKPLTEKDIQERLYGTYQIQPALKEEIEAEFFGPARKQKKIIVIPGKKLSFSIPWRQIFAGFEKVFAVLFSSAENFFRTILSKAATGWGLSILVVALLFMGIHALNGYRTQAMKSERPAMILTPAKENSGRPRKIRHKVAPPTQETVETSIQPLSGAAAPTGISQAPPTPSWSEKPYVIQVCTYARQDYAEKLVGDLKGSAISAFSEPLQRPNGKVFYAVFLGRFGTFGEAQARLEEFKKKPVAKDFLDSFIRTL